MTFETSETVTETEIPVAVETFAEAAPVVEEAPPEATPEETPAKPDPVQRRINRLVAERAEAKARADFFEQQFRERQSQQAPQQQTYEDPEDARISARVQEALAGERQRMQAQFEAQTRQAAAVKFQQQVEKAAAEMPDFEDVLADSDLPMSRSMQEAITESDNGALIAYYLAKNPSKGREIAAMSPVQQARAIGRLDATVATDLKPKATPAPKPLSPVSGSSKGESLSMDLTPEEWAKEFLAARRNR